MQTSQNINSLDDALSVLAPGDSELAGLLSDPALAPVAQTLLDSAERITRLTKIVEGRVDELMLHDITSKGASFSGSPLAFIVEFLAQTLGSKQLDTPLNFTAVSAFHPKLGHIQVVIQRVAGKTPVELASSHAAQLRTTLHGLEAGNPDEAREELRAYMDSLPTRDLEGHNDQD